MHTFFLICAVIGGTVMACQFVMTLVGLGDFDGDMDFDVPDDVDVDFGDADVGHVDVDGHGEGAHHGSSWLFGILSFRTIVAALTFFGLFGLAAQAAVSESDLGQLQSLTIQLIAAVTGGGMAMFAVNKIMDTFKNLGSDGTVRISRAVGQTGTVYIPIPGGKESTGKIQIKVQDRLVEYAAITSADEKLPTGAKVVVVGVVGPSTLEVEPIHQSAKSAEA